MTKPSPQSVSPNPGDPAKWKTDDEPMTVAQRAVLETLTREAGEDLPEDVDSLTKAEAALAIDELRRRAYRSSAPS
jgi:hypothetical protein